eukprot:TRINITY_DN78747_c0_g1_i1.p1 TRINITY_DN78747_c0_g1~~TRINITY_DN78747_c0_g1_i1.p1  ORF type:complete len:249 (+),score=53.32 TRINITY_DN78747_c0_g1_i1:53-799(+)
MELGFDLGIDQLFAKFRCWACQGGDEDVQKELRVPSDRPVRQQLQVTTALSSMEGSATLEGMASEAMEERSSPERPPSQASPRTPLLSPREHERQQLRELMKGFASRGMQGVPIHLVDEISGELIPASYRIDERLQCISFVAEESPTLRFSGSPSHSSTIEQVVEVVQADEASPHLELAAWGQLTEMERQRLLVLTYSIEPPASIEPLERRKVCFLEASEEESRHFATCMRILRRYFQDVRASKPRTI